MRGLEYSLQAKSKKIKEYSLQARGWALEPVLQVHRKVPLA
jgi:hypothetical protein